MTERYGWTGKRLDISGSGPEFKSGLHMCAGGLIVFFGPLLAAAFSRLAADRGFVEGDKLILSGLILSSLVAGAGLRLMTPSSLLLRTVLAIPIIGLSMIATLVFLIAG